MHVSHSILVITLVLWMKINVEGLPSIEECATSSSPLICIDDDIKIDNNTSRELNSLLSSLQNQISVHCDNVETRVKFFLYLLETSAVLNKPDRLTIDGIVLGEGNNCSSYAVLFVTKETATITIGQNASRLLDEDKINDDLKSLKKVNIKERAFEAINALKLAVTKIRPSQAGGGSWVIFIGLGFVGIIVATMLYWAWKKYRERQGLIPVTVSYL